MDSKVGGAAPAHMNTFEPTSDLIKEEECDTLLVYLPGFTKEQLRVQLAKSGTLKVSGARPIMGGDKWSSFSKDYPVVSSNCDTTKITAKFEGGILYIRQPKLIVPADHISGKVDKNTPPVLPPHHDTAPIVAPPPQEQATVNKTDDHNNKQTSVNTSDTKKLDEKSTEGKSEHGSMHDDHKGSTIGNSHVKDDELVNKGSTTNDSKYSVSKLGDIYRQNAVSLSAEKLKMGRQMMNMVVVVLFAFALGIYSTKFVSFFKKGE